MEENDILKKAVDTIEERSITFEIDVRGWFGRIKKRSFEIKPLTASKCYRISKLILDIDIKELTANDVFLLLKDHLRTCAEVIAIAVSDSRSKVSKKLVDLFFYNLDHRDMQTALNIVMQQMEVINFTNTIISIRTLNVLERKPAGAQNAKKEEVRPIVPGTLSATA